MILEFSRCYNMVVHIILDKIQYSVAHTTFIPSQMLIFSFNCHPPSSTFLPTLALFKLIEITISVLKTNCTFCFFPLLYVDLSWKSYFLVMGFIWLQHTWLEFLLFRLYFNFISHCSTVKAKSIIKTKKLTQSFWIFFRVEVTGNLQYVSSNF